ncbi:MAG: hypothetical protein IID44_31420 [Planctomycetes bacterium]|nr:hypothetical protein [Planctomycetota bacterium]
MWNCQKCGESLEDSSKTCWMCGTARDGTQDPGLRPEPVRPAVPDFAPQQEPADQGGDVRASIEMENRFLSGANWFFWIAGLSIVNSVLMLSGTGWGFIIGLGMTQMIDVIATEIALQEKEAATVLKLVAFGFDLVVAGMCAGVGLLARKRFAWAFILGMILYAMDGMIFLLFQDWLSFGFHVFALYGIWNGLKALRQLQ